MADHRTKRNVAENTYQTSLTYKEKFPVGKVKTIISEVLESRLANQTYQSDQSSSWTREISDEVKNRIKRKWHAEERAQSFGSGTADALAIFSLLGAQSSSLTATRWSCRLLLAKSVAKACALEPGLFGTLIPISQQARLSPTRTFSRWL